MIHLNERRSRMPQHSHHTTNQNFSLMFAVCVLFYIVWVRQTTFINSFIHIAKNIYTLLMSSTWNDFVNTFCWNNNDICADLRCWYCFYCEEKKLTRIRSSIIIHIKRFSTEFFIFNLFNEDFFVSSSDCFQ